MAQLILLGVVGCLTGIVSAAFIDGYALVVYLGWLAIEIVLLMALRRTDVKWLLTFALSTLVLIKYFSLSKNTPPKAFATAKAFGIIEENHLGRPPHGKARRRRPPQSNGY